MNKEKDVLKNDLEDDLWDEFFEDNFDEKEYPDFDDNEMIDRFEREMREELTAKAELEEKSENSHYSQQESKKGRYEFHDLVFDEEAGYIITKKYGEIDKFYKVITEEENEQRKKLHFVNASHFVSVILLSLTAIPATLYFQDIYKKSGLKLLMIMIGLRAPAAIFIFFFVGFVSVGLAYLFQMERDIKADKRLKPAIITYIAWTLIVIAVIVIMPSSEPY